MRAGIDRMRASRAFAGSERLSALLGFILDETLAGRGMQLRERVIGERLYRREPAYDPRIDSTVRVEMRRLRRKMEQYYAAEGSSDEIRIDIPTGQYAVAAARRAVDGGAAGERLREASPLFEPGRGATVAVMPFRALSRDPFAESFAESLTDEIMFTLSRAEGLRVASRSVTLGAPTSPRRLAEAAAGLDVDAIIQGTVRHAVERLRVTIEVSSSEGLVVFVDRFEAPESEWSTFEEKIARTLLNRVRLDNSLMRANEIRPRPEALEAHAGILRGRQLLDEQTPDGLRKAMALFDRVARSAPGYARGDSGVADCCCDMFRLGLTPRDEAALRGREAARRAIDTDPRSVEAHASLATIAAWVDFDREGADRLFSASLRLGENGRAMRVYGAFLALCGRHDEADAMLREARKVEPFSRQQDILESVCRYQSRGFGLVLDAFGSRCADLPLEARFYLGLAAIAEGDLRLAAMIAGSLVEAETPPTLATAGPELAARCGDVESAKRMLKPHKPASHFALATLAAAFGDEEQAIRQLFASVENREVDRGWITTDVRLDPLRSTRSFAEVVSAYEASWSANS